MAEQQVVDADAVGSLLEAEATGGIRLGIAVDQEDWEAVEGEGGGQVDGGGGFAHPAFLVDDGQDSAWGSGGLLGTFGRHRLLRRVAG